MTTGNDNEQFILERLKEEEAKQKLKAAQAQAQAEAEQAKDKEPNTDVPANINLTDRLPSIPEGYQSLPNIFAVSECFPSYRSRTKKYIENKIVSSNSRFQLEYVKGEAMDDRDEDLILQILFIYTKWRLPFDRPLRMPITHFIRAIGRVSGGSAYQWTLSRLEMLKNATFAITTNKFSMTEGTREYFNVLRELQIADGYITLKLDPRWLVIYRTDQILYIYYQTRSKLRSPHAKVIHKLLCTQQYRNQVISEDQLIRSLGWDGLRIRDMWKAIIKAMDELKEKKVVDYYEVTISRRGTKQLSIVVNQAVLKPGLYKQNNNDNVIEHTADQTASEAAAQA